MNTGTPPTTEYVLGFLFDSDKNNVALIEKQKPDWQKGYLNGIGGKIEVEDRLYVKTSNDAWAVAMSREFEEEAGVATDAKSWRHFATLNGCGWIVYCFTNADSDALEKVETKTNEQVHVVPVEVASELQVLSNLTWLIPMALDENMEHGQMFAIVNY